VFEGTREHVEQGFRSVRGGLTGRVHGRLRV